MSLHAWRTANLKSSTAFARMRASASRRASSLRCREDAACAEPLLTLTVEREPHHQ